jgi:Tfp pilus assembly protein PilN
LVTDACLLDVKDVGRVLRAAAAPSDVVCAIVEGCEHGRLVLEALGPAADVLPHAVANGASLAEVAIANGTGGEVLSLDRGRVWRSRWVRGTNSNHNEWAGPLARLNEHAPLYAGAYAAAVKAPTLTLLPKETRAARQRSRRTRMISLAAVALCLWLAAAGVYAARLAEAARSAERGLAAITPDVDSALALRRELLAVRSALLTVDAAQQSRSRTLGLLASLTTALGDSVFLTSLSLSQDSTLALSGYASSAASVLAVLERVTGLRDSRLEGPVIREQIGHGLATGTWDRFAVVSRVERVP